MRIKRRVIGLSLTAVLLVTGLVSAHEIIQGDRCHVKANTTITGDVFATCRDLIIDGRIEGNLFGIATTAVINGEIGGDIYLLAGQLDIGGSVEDDLHFAGGVLNVHDDSTFERGDLINVSMSATVADGAEIPGSVVSLGYQLLMDGTVDRDVSFWGSALSIEGTVDGNVDAQVGDVTSDPGWLLNTAMSLIGVDVTNPGLRIPATGSINGQLRYTGPSEGIISGNLAQEADYTPIVGDVVAIPLGESEGHLSPYLSNVVREFITLSLIGVVVLVIAPRLIQSPIQTLRRSPFNSLGVGIPAFFLPLVIFFMVAIVTLIAMALLIVLRLTSLALVGGLISGLLSFSGMGVFYFVAIFIARIVVSLAIGQVVVRATIGDDGSHRVMFLSLFVGILLLALATSLPTIGWIVNAFALAVGLGAVLTRALGKIRVIREAGLAAALYTRGTKRPSLLPAEVQTARRIPPPIIDDASSPGMDNLPDGFQWWDDV